MIRVIAQEKDDIENNQTTPPYAKLGKASIIKWDDEWRGGEQNCLDWVREKLLLVDIELEKSALESIAAFSRIYTHKPNYYIDKPVNVSI